jgi:hypothetical protein
MAEISHTNYYGGVTPRPRQDSNAEWTFAEWTCPKTFRLSEGHASWQPLSKTQEQMFVSWILEQERLEHARTHQRIRKFAAKIRGFSGEGPHRQELAHKVYGTKSSCSHEGWKEDRLSESPKYLAGDSGALLSTIQGL